MLDAITTSKFCGKLDADIMMGVQQKELISLSCKKKGANFMPITMHEALQWGPGDPYLEWTHGLIKPSTHVKKDSDTKETQSNTKAPGMSSKWKDAPEDNLMESELMVKIQKTKDRSSLIPINMISNNNDSTAYGVLWLPEGTQWSYNSCAYDAVVTVLFNTWKEVAQLNTITWAEINNNLMTELILGFNNHANGQPGQCLQSLKEVHEYM